MFCNKENINILTSLLVSHGVKRTVVCPGSRNAAIVHNLNECKEITCYPVTDERSAGFYALGLSLADNKPVAVCVTSGTALLNLAPAVAEATYQHHGLIVISADRPAEWIGQLDGQTLVQQNAFGDNSGKCVNLPEPHNDVELWYCNRLINEALLSVRTGSCKSVQINVPVSEPMFNFSVKQLPTERKIDMVPSCLDKTFIKDALINKLLSSACPMIVLGQISDISEKTAKRLQYISKSIVVINECLSSSYSELFDKVLMSVNEDDSYMPDFVLYIGNTLVSKRIKHFLRKSNNIECWSVSQDGEVHDVFMCLSRVIEGNCNDVIEALYEELLKHENDFGLNQYVSLWHEAFNKVNNIIDNFEPGFSQLTVVREFFLSLGDMDYNYQIHCANSMTVRLVQIYSSDYVWCNRGVNGIEGCVSTAAGFSLATSDMVFCITGDLSFFYDGNALWNQNIGGNLRIIILNNGGGGIFRSLKGLSESPAFESLISANHKSTAKGECEDHDVGYLSARNMDELRIALANFMTMETKRPLVLEVFTDQREDYLVLENLDLQLKHAF